MKIFKIIIGVLLLFGVIGGILYLKYRLDDNKLRQNMKQFDVEVYSEKRISNLVKNYTIINDKKINTNKLGTKVFKCFYKDKNDKKKKMYISVKVVDKTPPLVWLSDVLNVNVGAKDTLIDTILCGDNYDKRPDCKIIGNYELDKLGSYDLVYIAKDSSLNETKIPFKLNVVEKSKPVETKTLFSDIVNDYSKKNIKFGVDVSAWQGDIDFEKIKESGVSFVMIRVGYQEDIKGKLVLDKNFKRNIEEALKHDLDVGIYLYSKASSIKEAYKQAEYVHKHIKNYDIKLPVVFDWEMFSSFNNMNISLTDLNSISNVFMSKIEGYGYKSALYGSKNYLENIWDQQKNLVWLAHYTDKTNYNGKYFMWQICNDGIIDGVDGYIDIDILYENSL